jgi:hypothetical protein
MEKLMGRRPFTMGQCSIFVKKNHQKIELKWRIINCVGQKWIKFALFGRKDVILTLTTMTVHCKKIRTQFFKSCTLIFFAKFQRGTKAKLRVYFLYQNSIRCWQSCRDFQPQHNSFSSDPLTLNLKNFILNNNQSMPGSGVSIRYSRRGFVCPSSRFVWWMVNLQVFQSKCPQDELAIRMNKDKSR